MKRISLLFSMMCCAFISAQVGVGTTTPDASSILDISASDKGVLVPRVSLTDVTNTTAPINTPATGLLIWNTNAGVTGGNGVGFYYFNGAQWIPIQSPVLDDADFYESGTTSAPDNITDSMFHTGDVSIGSDTSGPKLNVTDGSDDTNASISIQRTSTVDDTYGLKISTNLINGGSIENSLTGTTSNFGESITAIRNNFSSISGSNGIIYGVYNNLNSNSNNFVSGFSNNISGTSTNNKTGFSNFWVNSANGNLYGLENTFNATSNFAKHGVYNVFGQSVNGINYGILNNLRSSSNSTKYGVYNSFVRFNPGATPPDGEMYGVYNTFDSGITGAFSKYGMRTEIPSTTAGVNYGLYSDVTASNSYSGYFLGRVSIGTSVVNNYILPLSRGTDEQIMQTDGTGNVTWVDKNDNSDLALVRAHLSGTYNQAATGASWVNIDYDVEDFDTNNRYNTGTNVFTANSAGYYRINASYHTTAQSNTNYYGIAIYINGTLEAESTYNHHNVGDVVRQVDTMVYLALNATVEVRIRAQSNAVNIDGFSGKSYMEIQQINKD